MQGQDENYPASVKGQVQCVPDERNQAMSNNDLTTIVQQLHQAIDAARKPGKCEYVFPKYDEATGTTGDEDAPCCVIGQFASLRGKTIAEMREWGSINIEELALRHKALLVPSEYHGAIAGLLRELQRQWDWKTFVGTDDERRTRMHKLVDQWEANQRHLPLPFPT